MNPKLDNNGLRIELLGGLRISGTNGTPVELSSRVAGRVLAHLALHLHRKHGREELVDLFWPDDDIEEGRAKLSKALNTIREWITKVGVDPQSALLAGRSEIRLNSSVVVTDVTEMDEALTAAAQSADASQRVRFLDDAIRHYRGELLPGFYDECFDAERNRLSIAFESALHDLALAYEQLGEIDSALEIALRAVALSPSNEDFNCAAMRLFAAKGQPSAVTRQYHELERALEAELGEKPCENTRLLMETLAQSGCETRAARDVPKPEPRASQPAFVVSSVSSVSTVVVAPGHRPIRARVALAAVLIISLVGLLIAFSLRTPSVNNVRTLGVADLPALAWRESYGPEEEKVGQLLLARWPEIEREVDRLRSKPAALVHFAAPLWRIAYTLGKGKEVAGWLKAALDSNTPMDAADEALAAANVCFELGIETHEVKQETLPTFYIIPYGERSHAAAVRSGDRWLIAHSLRAMGFAEAAGREPMYKKYRARYADSHAIFKDLEDERGMALVETSYASGYSGEANLVETPQTRYRECAHWAAKAYMRWERIGNSWGMGFTARLLQQKLAHLKRPVDGKDLHSYLDVNNSAIAPLAAERTRVTTQGRLHEAGRLLASLAMALIETEKTGRALRDLHDAIPREFAEENINLLSGPLAEYGDFPSSQAARRRLLDALRSIAAR